MKNLEQQLSENLLITSRHETQSPNSVREYFDAIPVDLLIEIFSLVPAKSIARFRCVSKFWESILRRPDFTELFTVGKVRTAGMYLGYDPSGKQFKVLCMTTSRDERPNTHLVLTLDTGKLLWRSIQHEFHFVENGRMCGQVCINGVLYLGAASGRSSVIVCFDVRSEKFGFINTVDDMSLGSSYILYSLKMFNYKGRLGIHYTEGRNEDKDIVLWVLEDAGNHKWSKHIYVLSSLGIKIVKENRFFGMTCTGEIVLAGRPNPNFYVFFYNLETNTFTRVNIQGLEEAMYPVIATYLDYEEFIPHEDVKKLGI